MPTLFERILASAADFLTFLASGIAVYLALFKRDEITLAFKYLVSYSKRLSLNELRSKLDKLNSLSIDNEEQRREVINVFNEIEGQINGNKELASEFSIILKKIQRFTKQKKIEEPHKRSLVSELREVIRTSELHSLNKKNKYKNN